MSFTTLQWNGLHGLRYIKDKLRAKQLFMDGRMVSRTGFYPELDTSSGVTEYKQTVDIISSHSSPLSWDSLEETSVRAMELGLPFVLGEIGWTDGDIQGYMGRVEEMVERGQVSGSLLWAMFGHAELYGHVIHDDGYTIYWPTGPEPKSFHHNNVAYRKMVKRLSDHMFAMSRRDIPLSYEISGVPPVITTLQCKVSQWVRVAFRGVAGAHLYEIFLDGSPIAIIEDRQDSPTYIHNPSVTSHSSVTVRPLGYGEEPLPGTDSEEKECVFL